MSEMQVTLNRIERRLDDQAARLDAVYRMLERRGILPRAANAGRGDAFFDEPLEAEEPFVEQHEPATGRRRARFHVGTATGV